MASAHAACLAAQRHRPSAGEYERRRPERTVLYRVVAEHWVRFVEHTEEQGRPLPRFVHREVEAYLRCGILEHGLLRLGCPACGFERLVAFSCKKRGFCPSCLSRRMTDTACHLRERVLPEVPLRQWVCSLPWELRMAVGYDGALCSALMGAFVEEVQRSYRWRAKRALGLSSVELAHTGAVTFIQRFDSALRLNPHAHTLSLDGVYVRNDDGELTFHPLPPPSAAEVAEVAQATARRAVRLLELRADERDTAEPTGWTVCCAASAQGLSLFGPRAGQPPLRLLDPSRARPDEPVAIASGFNVHAGRTLHGADHAQVERFCRYLARPPIAQDRLEHLDDGQVRYHFKRAWKDGSTAVDLEPFDLLARICALVPPPRLHMVRYHGVLSSRAKLRAEVVPSPPEPEPDPLQLQAALPFCAEPNEAPRRKPWAWLLRHVFLHDVSVCPRCQGASTWLEVATEPDAIDRAFADHGLTPHRPRAPPSPLLAPDAQLTLPL
jgi:hypothetical protein